MPYVRWGDTNACHPPPAAMPNIVGAMTFWKVSPHVAERRRDGSTSTLGDDASSMGFPRYEVVYHFAFAGIPNLPMMN